ncbi:MAG: glycosyltransferase [Puniceicoccales bacterium]|jgi:glycosyltransferase involved in cell wall biosynthesis|nr:glycosyltransferase [Puniceicoccales bacterium]
MSKYSVIIPVFNVEDFLPRAIESVLRQEDFHGDMELILVDDGSTDSSGQICDDFARRHAWAQVIHQPNRGLSAARNAGLDRATGEYVVFLDADDWFDARAFSFFENVLSSEGVDLLGFSHVRHLSTGVEIAAPLAYAAGKKVFVADILADNYFSPVVWGYVYKRSFLESGKLRFIEGILHEDEDFTSRVLCLAKTGYFTRFAGYHYFQRENSTMTRTDPGHIQRRVSSYLVVLEKLVEFQAGFSKASAQWIFLEHRLCAISYSVFRRLVFSTLDYSLARGFFHRLQRAGLLPLRKVPLRKVFWRPYYGCYRLLTKLHLPFWSFRLIYSFTIRVSDLQKRMLSSNKNG